MAHYDDNENIAVPDFVSNPNALVDVSATLEVVLKDIGDALERHYPNWGWVLIPNEKGGIVQILSLRLSGEWGWVEKIDKLQNHDRNKIAMEVGGHILERFGLERAGYSPEQWKRCRKDILGRPMPDQSDQDRKVRNRIRDKIVTEAIQEGVLEIAVHDIEAPHGGATRHIAIRENPDAPVDD